MPTITLPPNNRVAGNASHTTDHNQVVDAITAVNNDVTKGISPVNYQTGTTYTLALADAGKMVELDNAAAVTLTVPTNATAAFDVRTRIDILQCGAGQVTLVGAGSVVINNKGGLKISGQWAGATLVKRGTDLWVLIGALAA